MADHQYLSIGEVLGLLLEDFPDVTISKIRFLESQGLIEPERTPSGYRKFYDSDVELLRAILHEQKANFLPLKVIRDRIESGAIDSDSTGGRTPPRGIRNVEAREAREAREDRDTVVAATAPSSADAAGREREQRDSVFRRTDGGPEWAGGHALIPGETDGAPFDGNGSAGSPVTAAVPVIPAAPSPAAARPPARPAAQSPAAASSPAAVVASLIESPVEQVVAQPVATPVPETPAAVTADVPADVESAPVAQPETTERPTPADAGSGAMAPAEARPDASSGARTAAPARGTAPAATARELPYNPAELCAAAGITAAQLAELLDYGIISARGSGADTSFQPEAVTIASIAGQLLSQGIDGRHLRAWRQAAERESALFEQRIMPLLRQRNPQARSTALASLSELSSLGSRLHNALVDSLLQHHFDGT